MFINRRMYKQTVIYPYSGILLSNKKKPTTDTCSKVDESQKHCAEQKPCTHKKNLHCSIPFTESPRTGEANL